MKSISTIRFIGLFFLLTASYLQSASAQQVGQIEIKDAWARLPAAGSKTTMAYFEIINHGDKSDRFIGAASPWAERAIIAQYIHEGYNMKLRTVPSISLKAGGRARLSPSGYFVQLENLTQAVRPGVTIPLTLRFQSVGQIEIQAKVANQLLGNMD